MHGWQCEAFTGVSGLRWAEMPTPQPGPLEVRVAVAAASLNFPDLLTVEGKYQARPDLPFVAGLEFAGVVEACGAGVDSVGVGERVMTVTTHGGFATQACVPAAALKKVPAGMPLTDAAAFLMVYGTSHHALLDRAALRPGETVLVLGAAGGVGTAAVQIGKAAGARVIAAVSTEEKAALCRRIGADEAFNYTTVSIRDAVKSFTGGRGPDVIYDPVGGACTEPAFRSIAWRGRYLMIGFAGGPIPSLPLNLPLLKGASVVGVFWGDFDRREPAASQRAVAELSQWYAAGRIKPVIDCELPMARLPEAFDRMASRAALGKIVLVNNGDARAAVRTLSSEGT
jgi:NADPH2:quinone reductase